MEIIKEIISWTHIIAASLSLVFGAIVLFSIKGNMKHKKIGLYYFYAMLINNLTSLFMLNVMGKWFFPHYLAVACLIVIVPGLIVAKTKNFKHWLKVHIFCFVISLYLLVGGAINETFLHVESLRPYLTNGDPILGMTHIFAQIVFIFVLIYFLWKYRKMKTQK